MPTVNDILEIAQALESVPVEVIEERCVKVRNRNAGCTECIDACPVDGVLSIKLNEITLDSASCIKCSACCTACPTEALVSLSPFDGDLKKQTKAAVDELGEDTAVIACARMAARREANAGLYAEVPCLSRVDESAIVGLVDAGCTQVVLVDGVCSTCKYGATEKTTNAVVASANDLLRIMGNAATVSRVSEFPKKVLQDDSGRYGAARRRFFSFAKTSARDAAKSTVSYALKNETAKATLRERLGGGGSGRMPRFSAEKKMALLDILDKNNAQDMQWETRLWGNVSMDMDICNGCGMCAVFCPTDALKKSPVQSSNGRMQFEFSMADCVQCNLCADVCIKKCLKVSSTVSTSELFEFEPRTIGVPSAEDDQQTSSQENPYR